MNWNARYAADRSGLAVTPPDSIYAGNKPSDAFITTKGDLYFHNGDRSWRRHSMGNSNSVGVGVLNFVHKLFPNSNIDHPAQGWSPSKSPDDRITMLLHSCGNQPCNSNIARLVTMLRSHHQNIHATSNPSNEDYEKAHNTSIDLTKALLNGAQAHHYEYNRETDPSKKEEHYDNFWSHVNTINSIWGKPLNLANQKYSVDLPDYIKIHEDLKI